MMANQNLTDEQKERKREQNRRAVLKYAALHPERRKASLSKFREKNRVKILVSRALWRKKNPHIVKAQNAKHRAINGDNIRAQMRARRKTPEGMATRAAWVNANREKVRAACRAFDAARPEEAKARRQLRRARQLGAGGNYTASDIREINVIQKGRCALCRVVFSKTKRHIDHIIPLKLGGSNDRRNIQLLCKPCNLAKGAQHPIDYAQSLGLLL